MVRCFSIQISPEDIQWDGEDPGISRRGGYDGSGHGMNRAVGRDSVQGAGRGRGLPKGQSKKDFLPSQNGIGKKAPDDIQILHTDTLIKEVNESSLIHVNTEFVLTIFIYLIFLVILAGGEGLYCKSSGPS